MKLSVKQLNGLEPAQHATSAKQAPIKRKAHGKSPAAQVGGMPVKKYASGGKVKGC